MSASLADVRTAAETLLGFLPVPAALDFNPVWSAYNLIGFEVFHRFRGSELCQRLKLAENALVVDRVSWGESRPMRVGDRIEACAARLLRKTYRRASTDLFLSENWRLAIDALFMEVEHLPNATEEAVCSAVWSTLAPDGLRVVEPLPAEWEPIRDIVGRQAEKKTPAFGEGSTTVRGLLL